MSTASELNNISENETEKLYNISESEYGNNYKDHLLEQYKIYLEMIDRISSRRQSVNSFFLSINTALITLLGYKIVISNTNHLIVIHTLVGLCGMILCYIWYRVIKSNKGLTSGKFKILHRIEKKLPVSPYDAEWEVLGRGEDPKLYLPFTSIEKKIPWIFLFIHFVYTIPSLFKFIQFLWNS